MCFPRQIRAHLKEAVSFSIEHVHNDFSIYENVCINADEFRHVIEIYDFPPLFKTDDLLDAFTEYRCEPRVSHWKPFYISNVIKTNWSQTVDLAHKVVNNIYEKHICSLMCFSDGGMKIKWVDNTHALGVFSSESAGMSSHRMGFN